jgi:hypothetical protein
MYHDVKGSYWWNNMKKDITKFVEQCSTFQPVKAKHHRLTGTLKLLLIPKWKWDKIVMDLFWVCQRHLLRRFHLGCC